MMHMNWIYQQRTMKMNWENIMEMRREALQTWVNRILGRMVDQDRRNMRCGCSGAVLCYELHHWWMVAA